MNTENKFCQDIPITRPYLNWRLSKYEAGVPALHPDTQYRVTRG